MRRRRRLANHFAARVRTVAFRGAYAAYELEVPALGRADFYAYGQAERGSGAASHPSGGAVVIGWHPADGVIVEDDP